MKPSPARPLVHQAISACLVNAYQHQEAGGYDPTTQDCFKTLVSLLQQGHRPDPSQPLFVDYTRQHDPNSALIQSLEEELSDCIAHASSVQSEAVSSMLKEVFVQLGRHGWRAQINEYSILNDNGVFRASDALTQGLALALTKIAQPGLDRASVASPRKM